MSRSSRCRRTRWTPRSPRPRPGSCAASRSTRTRRSRWAPSSPSSRTARAAAPRPRRPGPPAPDGTPATAGGRRGSAAGHRPIRAGAGPGAGTRLQRLDSRSAPSYAPPCRSPRRPRATPRRPPTGSRRPTPRHSRSRTLHRPRGYRGPVVALRGTAHAGAAAQPTSSRPRRHRRRPARPRPPRPRLRRLAEARSAGGCGRGYTRRRRRCRGSARRPTSLRWSASSRPSTR